MSSHEQPVLLLNDDSCAIQIDVTPPSDLRPKAGLPGDDGFNRDRRNTLPSAGVAKSAVTCPGQFLSAIDEGAFSRITVRSTSCPSFEQYSALLHAKSVSELPSPSDSLAPFAGTGLLAPSAGLSGPSLLSLAASPMGSTLSIDARCNDLDPELDTAVSSDSMEGSEGAADVAEEPQSPTVVRNMRDVPAKLLRQMFAQRTRESMELDHPVENKCAAWLQSIDETDSD